MTDQHTASRSAREEALRRLFDLPWRDMYEAWAVVGSYLTATAAGGESREQKRLRLRAEALDDVAAVARELSTPEGTWPTVTDYQRVAKELDLRCSSQQVIRRWGLWEDAGHALVGDRLSETPEQRAIRRASSGKARSHEDRLVGLRDWLRSTPVSLTKRDYDRWARRENHRRGPTCLPYVGAHAISIALALSWRWSLAVADYDVELQDAQARYLEELDAAAGPLKLVGARGVALILGTGVTSANVEAQKPGFPVHVANIGPVRAWYREDIEAYRDGRRARRRIRGELNDRLMGSLQVRGPLGMRADTFITAVNRLDWHRVPEPSGQVAQTWYWFREDVAQWVATHPERLAANRDAAKASR